jgi:hypothetical protein
MLIDGTPGSSYCSHLLSLLPSTPWLLTSISYLRVRDMITLGSLVTTFGAHCSLSSKTTLIMPPRKVSQCLYPGKALPKMSTQRNPPLTHPSTQSLSTITEGSEHSTFSDIPEVQLHQPANLSTTTVGSIQNGGSTSSTQKNGCAPHQ